MSKSITRISIENDVSSDAAKIMETESNEDLK